MSAPLSRRAALSGAVAAVAGMGLAATAVAAPVLSAAAKAAPVDEHWNDLLAAYERADATMLALGKEHGAASDAYMAGRKLLGDKPKRPENEYPRPIVEMTLAELRDGDFAPSKVDQAKYEADLADWTAREADLNTQTMRDINERWEASVDKQCAAADAVFAHPVPHLSGLLFKLSLAEQHYRNCDLDSEVMAQVFADVRRLAAAEV